MAAESAQISLRCATYVQSAVVQKQKLLYGDSPRRALLNSTPALLLARLYQSLCQPCPGDTNSLMHATSRTVSQRARPPQSTKQAR